MTYTLGIDSSTQSVKALVYEVETGRVVTTVAVNFGKDLPEFKSPDGFLPNADPLVRRADPRMWLSALGKVLSRLHEVFDTSKIAAIGGDGQFLDVDTCSFGSIGVIAIPEFARFYRHVLVQKRFPHHGAFAFAHCGGILFEALKLLGVADINTPKPAGVLYPDENPFFA